MLFFLFNKYNYITIKLKYLIFLFSFCVYRDSFINIYYINLFEIYILNKIYIKIFKISDIFTFNYFRKKFIFICLTTLRQKSFYYNIDFFLFLFYNICHCFLHSQNFKDNSKINTFYMNFIQIKIFLFLGF